MEKVFNTTFFLTVLIFFSYANLYLFNTGVTSVKPLYLYFFTITLALNYIVYRHSLMIQQRHRFVIAWINLYICNTTMCFIYSNQGEVEVQALVETVEICALIIAFLVLFQSKSADRLCRMALLLVVLISVPINFYDFVFPAWSKVPGRAAGLYANPTISGTMIVLAMAASVQIVPRHLRLVYCCFAGLSVLVTFSRGPWLFWELAVGGLAWIGSIEFVRKNYLTFLFTSILVTFVIVSILSGGFVVAFNATGLEKYLTPSTYDRLGGGGNAFGDYSTISRVLAAEEAWKVVENNPWMGKGLGVDRNWDIGAHNTFLRMAAEGGILRLLVFVCLIIILWKSADKNGKLLLVIYIASCLTSHDQMRDPALVIYLMLIYSSLTNKNSILHKETQKSQYLNKSDDLQPAR